jgi:integrase
MSGPHFTEPPKSDKPAKPYPDFPLFPHATRRWAKKIRGKLHYFGPWDDPDSALAKYLEQKDALHAGRKPRTDPKALTVKDVANAFLNAKQALVKAGELAPVTWAKYKRVSDLLIKHFGKHRIVADLGPDDFATLRNKMSQTWGPLRVRDFVQHIRSVFKYAFESELIDRPMRFGPGFARPSKKVLRLARAAKGKRLFTPEQLRTLLDAAGPQLRAMLLLGINSGLGNTDCARLSLRHLDLDGGWLNYARPKTGIDRRCPLWPETIEALRAVLAKRPEPKDPAHADLVFLTKYRTPWVRATQEAQADGTVRVKFDDAISKETAKLLKALGLRRPGLNFYSCRHVLETVGGAARDQVAIDHIMGHADASMAATYREEVGDDRLRAVADHVRRWLLGEKVEGRHAV